MNTNQYISLSCIFGTLAAGIFANEPESKSVLGEAAKSHDVRGWAVLPDARDLPYDVKRKTPPPRIGNPPIDWIDSYDAVTGRVIFRGGKEGDDKQFSPLIPGVRGMKREQFDWVISQLKTIDVVQKTDRMVTLVEHGHEAGVPKDFRFEISFVNGCYDSMRDISKTATKTGYKWKK